MSGLAEIAVLRSCKGHDQERCREASNLMEAVRSLPAQTKEALVDEFTDRLADFADPNNTREFVVPGVPYVAIYRAVGEVIDVCGIPHIARSRHQATAMRIGGKC